MATLFGHLALRFASSQAENLATEGLHFILGSVEARRQFSRFLQQAGVPIAGDLSFATQASEADGAIPDLVGKDAGGKVVALVESKFWAGLTANQPNTYLGRLQSGGVLLFIAPSQRFESLWPELRSRCREGGFAPAETVSSSNWRHVDLAGGRKLAMTSWGAILDVLYHGLLQAGELTNAADVLQLRGLTERMDDEAFLPLRSEELTSDTGRRIAQFCVLVDSAVDRLRAEKLADTTRLRASGGRYGAYNRYLRIHGHAACLYFDPAGWFQRGNPITLWVKDASWKASRAIADALSPLGRYDPPRFIDVPDDASYIPIQLPLGKERDQVLEEICSQIREVASLLAPIPPVPAADLPEVPAADLPDPGESSIT